MRIYDLEKHFENSLKHGSNFLGIKKTVEQSETRTKY